jgi:hypothetical protein
MADLRKLARGRECHIRVPGICCHDPTRVVGCHYRLPGLSGMGIKASDIFIAYGCQPCHDVCDGRTRTATYSRDELRLMLAEGVMRTIAILVKEQVIRW